MDLVLLEFFTSKWNAQVICNFTWGRQEIEAIKIWMGNKLKYRYRMKSWHACLFQCKCTCNLQLCWKSEGNFEFEDELPIPTQSNGCKRNQFCNFAWELGFSTKIHNFARKMKRTYPPRLGKLSRRRKDVKYVIGSHIRLQCTHNKLNWE